MVELISGIASQTNLLALNATIEAARGRRGRKGFCRRGARGEVARGTDIQATAGIGSQINAIQAATADAVSSIEAITALSTR